jgi:hypothetical protein
MEEEKSEGTIPLQRLATLPYNPFFYEEVRSIRQKYNIPSDSRKAVDWFRKYIGQYEEHSDKLLFWELFQDDEAKPDSLESLEEKGYAQYKTPANTLIQIGYGSVHLLQQREIDEELAKAIMDTEVPLERDVVELLRRFQLPRSAFYGVMRHILLDANVWEPSYWFPLQVYLDLEEHLRRKDLTVTVAGIGPWTTKMQWEAIWHGIEVAVENHSEFFHMEKPSKKHATIESYQEQMQRWADWYELSQIQGMGPTEALKKWIKDNPEQAYTPDGEAKYDVSTVTKAIQEFREIMTPLPSPVDY